MGVDSFYIARQKNAGRKTYQDVIQLLKRQHKEPSKLQTVSSSSLSEVLQKASNSLHTSSKLMAIMDWIDTWHAHGSK